MANIFDIKTKTLLLSKNTPDYRPGGILYELNRYIENPVYVPDCEKKFIVVEGETIREMTQPEKDELAYSTESTIYLIAEKQILTNKNAHEYEDNTDAIINPVMPACDIKYTKVVDYLVVEMTAKEKAVVDAPQIEKELSITEIREAYLAALTTLDTIINTANPTSAQVVASVKAEAQILKKLLKFTRLNVVHDLPL